MHHESTSGCSGLIIWLSRPWNKIQIKGRIPSFLAVVCMTWTKSKTNIGIYSRGPMYSRDWQELVLLTCQIFWGSLLLERFFALVVPAEEVLLTAPSHHRFGGSYEHLSCGSGSGGSVIKWPPDPDLYCFIKDVKKFIKTKQFFLET